MWFHWICCWWWWCLPKWKDYEYKRMWQFCWKRLWNSVNISCLWLLELLLETWNSTYFFLCGASQCVSLIPSDATQQNWSWMVYNLNYLVFFWKQRDQPISLLFQESLKSVANIILLCQECREYIVYPLYLSFYLYLRYNFRQRVSNWTPWHECSYAQAVSVCVFI